MLELDGTDAGGQFLRSALSLAALRDEAVRIENVRGNRSTSGLRPQHRAVVEVLAELADASVTGDEVGAETITFEPGNGGRIDGGTVETEIQTAGSLTLLFDAALPLATALREPLTVVATGGTDVAWSPPVDYLRRVKLPLLSRFGLNATIEVERRGFYPAGGGRATLRLAPSTLSPIELTDSGELTGVRIYSTESASLADANVADRQLGGVLGDESAATTERDWPVVERVRRTVETDSPGSAVVIRLDFEASIAGVCALGERGTPAERVGKSARDAAVEVLTGDAPVDCHLGDQLLVFLAVAGGRLCVPALTDHVETSLALFDAFDLAVARDGHVIWGPDTGS